MTYIHTTPWALYNEIDEFAAAWLEQLIARGLIARGIVDGRSIVDIRPDDLRGFRQVHLFAGIGVWSYAFRRAGITDDTEAWSASCPCQPFSSAGEGGGMDDERHLWPHAHHLIRERRPRLVFGEQVASKDGLAWLDLVQADLAGTGYAFGAVDTCAAGFGAPHIRQRQYWFGERLEHAEGDGRLERGTEPSRRGIAGASGASGASGLDHHHHHEGLEGLGRRHRAATGQREGSIRSTATTGELGGLAHDDDDDEQRQRGDAGSARGKGLWTEFGGCSDDLGLADITGDGCQSGTGHAPEGSQFAELGLGDGFCDLGLGDSNGDGAWGNRRSLRGALNEEDREFSPYDVGTSGALSRVANTHDRQLQEPRRRPEGRDGAATSGRVGHNRGTGPTNGFWGDVDWLHCRDERWRPVEPGTFPLAHGAALRMGCVCAGCGVESIREGSVSILRFESQGFERCEPEALLRQGVLSPSSLGGAPDEQEHGALSSEEIGTAGILLGMLFGEQSPCSPQGSERVERRSGQSASALSGVPSDRAYGHADIDLLGMPHQLHREITSEPEQDLFCEVCQRVGTHFCEEEVGGGRVGKLRGYGNAINAEQAIGFIEAYLEIKALEIEVEPVPNAPESDFEDVI